MYHNFTVRIPVVPGKIVLRKKGPSTFVFYQTERLYDKKRKFNIPKRLIIGKAIEGDMAKMYPNDTFLELFPETVLPEERAEAKRSCCLRIGPYIALKTIENEYSLMSLLTQWFGTRAGLLLDLASYLIVNEDNACQYYPDYAFCHPLFTSAMQIVSDSTVSRVLQSTQREEILGFLNDWNERQDHRQRIYIFYDSTNKYCQAGDIELAEFGNAKDGKEYPIVNVALVFDKNNKVPLFYEEYPGSINDVSQLRYLIDKVVEYDYRHIGFILDRGYFSRENIQYMDEKGYAFVIMVKGCKPLVSELVEAVRGSFETDRGCRIEYYGVYGTTKRRWLYAGDEKGDRYFHIYFSPTKMASEREEIEEKISRMAEELKKVEGKEVQISDYCRRYFDCTYSGKTFLFAREKEAVIERELELCGYFCLISSEAMSAREAYVLYKSRDVSEKLFRADKTFLGSKTARVHSREALSTKIFIEFIALIMRNRLYNLLKEQMFKQGRASNFLTVPAAIRELEKIEMVRRSTGLYRLDHAVTRRQKIILSALGINEVSVRGEAVAIANRLRRGTTEKETIDEEEDMNNGENEITIID